ncbi:MAG: hypothetical protein JSS32_06165 [Verrucomicrobia bacterium]|nr:hypothetical protein [Verrucomicrobiota bacterium]
MSYDTGNFSLFNTANNLSILTANLISPTFAFPSGTVAGSLGGRLIAATASPSGALSSFYAEQIALTLTATGGSVSSAFSLYVTGPTVFSGTVANAYSLFVTPSSGAGSIINNYTAYFGGKVGIGTTTPLNLLDVPSGVVIGANAGALTAPTNGLIVSGSIGVATPTPAFSVDVNGIMSANRVYSAQTTYNTQNLQVFEGNSQGGFGGGSLGTQKAFNLGTFAEFDMSSFVNPSSVGYFGAVFDGRYIYYVPNYNGVTVSGFATRYDTTLPFNASASYATYDLTANVFFQSLGFQGGIFDGRYIYYVPNQFISNGVSGTVTRYDTTLPFTSSSSYATANMASLVSGNSRGYSGAVFDGRYLYYVPNILNATAPTYNGQITRYDTTASFTTGGSYSTFDLATISTDNRGYNGGAFDGRFVYFTPYLPGSGSTLSGNLVRYDTTTSFGSAGSYSFFDVSVLNTQARGFWGAIFDGRYLYLAPYYNGTNYSGLAVRYDTTLSFSTSTSFAFFDMAINISTQSIGFNGGVFDGRYVYYSPYGPNNVIILVVRYDTTLPFTASSSYATFDVKTQDAGLGTFSGIVYDGKYVYIVPFYNNFLPGAIGTVVRFDAYSGPQQTAATAVQSASGFAVGSYAGTTPPNGGLIVPGSVGVGVSSPASALDATGGVVSATRVYSNASTFNNQLINLAEGNNQGGFASGSIGTNKTISSNTTQFYNTALSLTVSVGFFGGVFDGRYVYYVPSVNSGSQSGKLLRYDSIGAFGASFSYTVFDTAVVQSNSVGFLGGIFDGRYLYLVPRSTDLSFSGQITRFDTTLSFTAATSYAFFDTGALNAFSRGFIGAIFDGTYIYFVPNFDGNQSAGQVTRYDTSQSFTSSGSYSFFDLRTNINSLCTGFYGGTYDGRYVYFSPLSNTTTISGQLTRYDTTLPFSASASYSTINLRTAVNSMSVGFIGSVFDGRYIYFIQTRNLLVLGGQITRYDTSSSFSASSSYAYFDTAAYLNSSSVGFQGGIYDGKYLYLVPNGSNNLGQITRYDTTLPFSTTAGYSVFNTASAQSNSKGFVGAVYDGKYIYFVPNNVTASLFGQITRIDAYSGSQATAITAQQAAGGFSIGAFAGTAPPTGGLIVSGNTGIGTSNPTVQLDVGSGVVNSARIYTTGLTTNNQLINIAEGNNQGGYSSGVVGTNKIMGLSTTLTFDMSALVNSNAVGFQGVVFDGRFIYFVPNTNLQPTNSGLISRYDTTQSLSASASYAVFDSIVLNSQSCGFEGGLFDGRYVYFVPNGVNSFGLITRYDSSLSFTNVNSYAVYDTKLNINSLSFGFFGGIFDGRYIYYAPFMAATRSGQITRFDTTASFTTASSYSIFNAATVNTLNNGFIGGVYDGQYVYYVPNLNILSTGSGQILRYDTSQSFSSSASYSFFDMKANVNSLCFRFYGGVYDGRYVYFIPFKGISGIASGVIARYDTNLPFSTAGSYASFDLTANINSLANGFEGGVFDGRYLYLVPNQNANFDFGYYVTRYDTTMSFSSSASYSILDTSTINSPSVGFSGAIFDGKYIYFVPFSNTFTRSGLITRIDAYPGVRATALLANQAPNGFTIGNFAGLIPPVNGLLASGSVGVGVATPATVLDVGLGVVSASKVMVPGTTLVNQLVTLAEGNSQSGLGSGVPGSQKTMSANTTLVYNTIGINTGSLGFSGSVFDGRFLYFVPNAMGQITRYDTTLPYSLSTSYTVFDTAANLNSNSLGFRGGIFDGRYVYLVPNSNSATRSGQITRYDTTNLFATAVSYSLYDMGANVNSNSVGFFGAVFDGRYIYFVPNAHLTTLSGQITRFDTTASFTTASSYSNFDTKTAINSNSVGFAGGTFDGRYVYLAPNVNTQTLSGQITRYDTSLPFSTGTSYSIFNTQQLSNFSVGFIGAVFDGQYIYFVPNASPTSSYSGQITRYNTLASFSVSTSYDVYDTKGNLGASSSGFFGGMYDGRYLYLVPNQNGQVTRYDTTNLFTSSLSYTVFDTAASVNSNSTGFQGAAFDGKYLYLVPNGSGALGQITRLDAYPGQQFITYNNTVPSSTGFSIGTSYPAPLNGLLVVGSVGIGTTSPTSALSVAGPISANRIYQSGSTYNNQLIGLAEGNSQGGYGGGTPGTNKTMSSSTTALFDMSANVSSLSKGYFGGAFDGRYLYFSPDVSNNGFLQVTRYDTFQSFSASSSYSFFQLSSIDATTFAFHGAAFDGRYVYYIPYNSSNLTSGAGTAIRFDTTLSFTSSSSYASFNMATNVNANCVFFNGAVFDGRYLYYVPFFLANQSDRSGQIARYDTSASFTSASSYVVYDTAANVNPLSGGFFGSAFDGRYIYFAPNTSPGGGASGLILQYDTTLSFTSASSYATYDSTQNDAASVSYTGALFDGKYVYYYNSTKILRYDTAISFGASSSYTIFTISNYFASSGFTGAAFDGRYLYFSPNGTSILRYDATQSFAAAGSYTTQTNSVVNIGALFDGRYVYFIPNTTGQITRVDAYPGPQAALIAGSQAPNGFTIGTIMGPTATPNDLLVGGNIGVGTTTPGASLDVRGVLNARQQIRAGASTLINQSANLTAGTNQGGLGGGNAGSKNVVSSNSAAFFNSAAFVDTNSVGFSGAVFDGRYIYYVPNINAFGSNSGQITRYDTTLPLSSSNSYAIFNTGTIQSNSRGFAGGIYDGRYVYFIPNNNGALTGQITRFDTASAFSSSASYTFFDTTLVDANSKGFSGGVFDGRYLYLVPNANGQITQYDTTLPFTASSSYLVFDTTLVDPNSQIFRGGVYDGQYIYFVPSQTSSGQITRYDTTLGFATASSYSVFDTAASVQANSKGFSGAVFDGRYIYFVPFNNGTYSGQYTRFDTTLPFATAGSYSTYNLTFIDTHAVGFQGATFDGRFVYFTPNLNGYVVQYDTTAQSSATISYTVFNATQVSGNNQQFIGSITDGKYVYFVPNGNGSLGQILQFPAYIGPKMSYLNALKAPSGLGFNIFPIGSQLGLLNFPSANTSTTATAGAATNLTQATGYLTVQINGVSCQIPFFDP